MTVIVPVQSPAWFAYNQIATLTALIAATTSGSPARYQYQEQLNQLQRQLARLHEERGSEIDDAASDERGRVRAAPRSKWGGEKEATRV